MKFLGHIFAHKRKTDDEAADDDAIMEIVDLHKDGLVEFRFDDRDEGVYVRFKLQDFIAAVATFAKQSD